MTNIHIKKDILQNVCILKNYLLKRRTLVLIVALAEIVIRIQDWGCGIDSSHLPRLFERFYRVDQARSRQLGGTGLGLAIVNHIAQVHYGSVSVKSTLGKGSRFSIHLPIT